MTFQDRLKWYHRSNINDDIYFTIGRLFYELNILEDDNYWYSLNKAADIEEHRVKKAIDDYRCGIIYYETRR